MNDRGDQPIHDVEQRLNSRCTWFTAHITTLVHVLTDASAWDDIVASLAILVKRTPSQQIAKAKNATSTCWGTVLSPGRSGFYSLDQA